MQIQCRRNKMMIVVFWRNNMLHCFFQNRIGLVSTMRRVFRSRNAAAFLCLAILSLSACAQENIPITWDHQIGVNQVHPNKLSDIDEILENKWKLPLKNKNITQSFNVRGEGNERMVVDSCETLFEADKRRLEKTSSYREFKIYRSWAASCYALRALSRATEANRSFVQDFSLDADHVRELPVGMASMISNSDVRNMLEIRRDNGTLGNYIGGNPIHVHTDGSENGPRSASIIYSGVRQNIHLLSKADFNKDGVQDLLISASKSVEDGSYAARNLFVVTRMRKGGPLKIIKQFPVMGPSVMESDVENMEKLEKHMQGQGPG